MNARGTIFLAAALAACSGASPGADDAAAREARAQVERTMNAFAARDVNGFSAGLADDVVGYETDLEGKPVRLGSRGDAARFASAVFGELGRMGAALKLDVHATDCRAAAGVAWCTVEFDARATMPDGSASVQPTRNTVVLRKESGGWKWAHWHSSPAGPATQPPPAAPAS